MLSILCGCPVLFLVLAWIGCRPCLFDVTSYLWWKYFSRVMLVPWECLTMLVFGRV